MALSSALELFHQDFGRYPTMQEGLAVLVGPTVGLQATGKYPTRAYLDRVSADPWGHEYQYRIPGTHGGSFYDLWSYGADGLPGGRGLNADVGTWPGSIESYRQSSQRAQRIADISFGLIGGFVVGVSLGLPLYVFVAAHRKRRGLGIRQSLHGFHLRTLIGLICFCMFFFLFFGPVVMD